MKKRILFLILTVPILFSAIFFCSGVKKASADELSDAVEDQVENLAIDDLKEYFNNNEVDDFDFFAVFKNLINGKYEGEESVFGYLKNILFSEIKKFIPMLIGIVIVALLCEIIQNSKSAYLSDSVGTIVKFVTVLTVVLILSSEFISIWNSTKKLIENIGKFSEIMSPIILTLMVASGGAASAAMYKPSVVFFTNIIINIFYAVVLPIIGIMTVFNVISHFSKEIKLKRFSDFFGGILKWVFGIIISVYGFFITLQGLSVSATDGISAKVAKYAVSNSVPIVGGLIRDGLDVVAAGSVIVKNALGVAGLIGVFYIILAPILHMVVFSLILKLAAAISGVFAGDTVPNFLATISKTVNYLIASVLTVGLMAFLTTLLMIFSANSVI